jgi:hypothetical protein
MFSHPWGAVNYTVLTGSSPDREARSLLRDAIMSCVNSTHYRLLPSNLLFDARGTVYCFVVVLRGEMYSAHYSEAMQDMVVDGCDYAVWRGRIPIPNHYLSLNIPDVDGKPVPFGDALYWFGDHVQIEIVRDTAFGSHLEGIERAFQRLTPQEAELFGKPWTRENFPKAVGPAPTLVSSAIERK